MSRRIRIAAAMAVAGLAAVPASAQASGRVIAASAHVRASVAAGTGAPFSGGSLPHVVPLRLRNPAAHGELRAGKSGPTTAAPTATSPTRNTAIFGGSLNAAGLSAADEFAFVGGEPGVTPPDSTGAIGPFQYIEIVNSEIAMWSRADLSMIGSRVSLDTFDNGSNSCDPQIKYDPQSGHWFYLALQCGAGTNELFVGWSKSSNPSDLTSSSWCQFTVPSTPTTSLDDYPKLGLDAGHIIIGTNLFNATGSMAFQTAHIMAGPKPPAGTITSCGSPPTFTVFGSPSSPLIASSGNPAFTPEPATVADGSSQTGYIIAADQDPNTMSGSNLMLWHIGGTAAVPTLVSDGDVSVSAFSAPAQGISQPGSTNAIDPMDGRLTQAVMANDPNAGVGGAEAIWTQHTIDNGAGGTDVRWYEVNPSTATLHQFGTITDSAGFAFNGAIAPTLNGGAVINYNTGGSTQTVDVKAQAESSSLGTMAGAGTLATSTAIDSDLSCPSSPGGGQTCRWGDYAGSSADPACPDVAWGSSQITIPAVNPTDAQWRAQNFALTPSSAPLLACFTATPNPVDTGTTVNFDAGDTRDSGGTPTTWTWDFGDGGSASTKTATHSYSAPGTYTVKLTVGDGTNTATATQLVTVVGTPTASSFTASPSPQTAGSPVSFDASSASDSGTTLTYTWDFGDGASVSGPNAGVTHRYSTAGKKTVSLTVSDGFGHSSGPVTRQVTIDGPPSASFSDGPNPVTAGSPVSFDGSGSTDPDGSGSATNIPFSDSWNFGDGTAGGGVNPTHTYSHAGVFTVTLTISDSFSAHSSVSHTVTVVGPPSASFTASPGPGITGSPTTFNAGASSDPGTPITAFTWNFGDGGGGSGIAPAHTYAAAGTYTATLTVSDGFGETSSTSRSITVVGPLSASFTASPNPGTAGQSVGFNAGGSSDPGATITSYSWNFGDGSAGGGQTASHSYSRPGTYTVTLVTSDGAGQTAVTSRSVTITAPRLSGTLGSRRSQRRAAVLKHGLAVAASVSEGVSVRFVITRQGRPAKRHGKPTTVIVLRTTRRLNAGASRSTLKLNSQRLPGSGAVTLTVRAVFTDAFGQSLPVSVKVTLT